MKYEKSKIYTKKGDKGQTSLLDGSLVSKSDLRVEAYGTLDEANCWIGVAISFTEDKYLLNILTFLNHKFYNCSSNVAAPSNSKVMPVKIIDDDVIALEGSIDILEYKSGSLAGFVLPGGGKLASFLHVARTVSRRAERLLVALAEIDKVDDCVLKFVNRSSDVFFAAARYANVLENNGDLYWNKDFCLKK